MCGSKLLAVLVFMGDPDDASEDVNNEHAPHRRFKHTGLFPWLFQYRHAQLLAQPMERNCFNE